MRGSVPGQMILDLRGRPLRWTANDYRMAREAMGLHGLEGACPIEAGFLGALEDLRCRHDRLPWERTCCP